MTAPPRRADGGRRGLAFQGFPAERLQPEGHVFMLAVVPQFVNPDRAEALQYIPIGMTLLFTDIDVMNGYALFATRVAGLLRSPRRSRWLNRLFGALFLGAAALLAAFGDHS